MRLCGGRGLGVFGDRAFYDFGDDDGARWLPLVGQSRPRYAEQAILVTPVFDGREPDCVWHRLMLDARIPPEASVTVCSRTGHDRRSVENASWRAEPTLLLRPDGSEQPYARGPKTAPLAGEGTWELLFQQARGQFLQLRLVLRGDGRTTPRLRGLRAYYPRFSYLDTLPTGGLPRGRAIGFVPGSVPGQLRGRLHDLGRQDRGGPGAV